MTEVNPSTDELTAQLKYEAKKQTEGKKYCVQVVGSYSDAP